MKLLTSKTLEDVLVKCKTGRYRACICVDSAQENAAAFAAMLLKSVEEDARCEMNNITDNPVFLIEFKSIPGRHAGTITMFSIENADRVSGRDFDEILVYNLLGNDCTDFNAKQYTSNVYDGRCIKETPFLRGRLLFECTDEQAEDSAAPQSALDDFLSEFKIIKNEETEDE